MSKILIINNGIGCGGIETASATFANYCIERGYDTVVVALYPSEPFQKLNSKIRFYEPQFNATTFIGKILYIKRITSYLRKIVHAESPDVIIAHGEWTNGFVAFVLGKKIPLYLQNHMNPDLRLKGLHQWVNNKFYKRAAGVIVLTEYASEVVRRNTDVANIAVFPNPVRVIHDTGAPKQQRIVTVGRLSIEKGHRILIDAFAQAGLEDWMLDIVGDGPERVALEKQVAELHLADRVVFHGYQTNIDEYLSRSEIFVLPSLSECFPLALTEAMSLPMACITTDCLAGKEVIVQDKINGLKVAPDDAVALSVAIQKLASDKKLREKLAREALKIRDDLSKERIYDAYLQFIKMS